MHDLATTYGHGFRAHCCTVFLIGWGYCQVARTCQGGVLLQQGVLPSQSPLHRFCTQLLECKYAFCVSSQGILYEDTFLQIGLQSSFAASQGQLVLFLGNKSQGSLERLSITCGPNAALALAVGPYPQQLAPKRQERVTLQVSWLGFRV